MGQISRDSLGRLILHVAGGILLAAFAVACGTSEDFYSPQPMGSVPFGADRNQLQMEVVPRVGTTSAGASIHLAVSYRKLAFISSSDGYRADYTVTAQMQETDGGQVVHQGSWRDSILLDSYQATQEEKEVSIHRHVSVRPGTYNLQVIFEDNTTGRKIAGRKQLEIPSAEGKEPVLGLLYLQSKSDSSRYSPVVSDHIPGSQDSLRARTSLYNTKAAELVRVQYSLLRFQTDFRRAEPPHSLTPMFGSLEYKGITYEDVDTVKTTRYELSPPPEESMLNFELPHDLESGVYQVNVVTRLVLEDSSEVAVGRQNRQFSIKGQNFPHIRSLSKAARALSYVLDEDEVEAIQEAGDVEAKKHRFDAFWGKQVGNKSRAREVLQLYFDRVEQANRMFTNHKEGWKTDRGMIYVVFGSPRHVENYVNSEVWFYGDTSSDATDIFLFKKVRRHNEKRGTFYNYILQRQPYYSRKWERQVGEWRQGQVY